MIFLEFVWLLSCEADHAHGLDDEYGIGSGGNEAVAFEISVEDGLMGDSHAAGVAAALYPHA